MTSPQHLKAGNAGTPLAAGVGGWVLEERSAESKRNAHRNPTGSTFELKGSAERPINVAGARMTERTIHVLEDVHIVLGDKALCLSV
jgi:hypothetical protein